MTMKQTFAKVAQRAIRLIDTDGEQFALKHVDNKPRVSSMPYLYDISEGNVSDHEALRRFGHNESVGTAWESVNHHGGLATYLSSAERLQIASSDVKDDVVGVGARTLRISGLDGDYTEISETVDLDGTTNVLTDSSFLRVHTLTVLSVGSENKNAGDITASNNADSAVLMLLGEEENESLCACYTVPADHTAYVVQAMATEASSKGSEFGFFVKPFGGLWYMKRTIVLLDSNIVLPMPVPMKLTEKTDIEIRARGILAGAHVTAGFTGWIEAN